MYLVWANAMGDHPILTRCIGYCTCHDDVWGDDYVATNPRKGVPKQHSREIITKYRDGHIALAEALQSLSGKNGHTVTPEQRVMSKARLQSILNELERLSGLHEVKQTVREIFALLYMQQERGRFHLPSEPVVLHMVFKGNPGTGKTTVARLLGRMFQQCGLLEKGHVVEVERADLVGEYIGHTAQKTKEVVQKAMGGILFIDEAYSLARGGEKDFGREAIDCLVKSMEDHRNQLIVILAGYEREIEWFLRTNPGLPSRFPIHLKFPDYDIKELVSIAKDMANSHHYTLTMEAEMVLRRRMQAARERGRDGDAFSNARFVRNAVERAIRQHAVRLFDEANLTRDAAMTLTAQDFRWEGETP